MDRLKSEMETIKLQFPKLASIQKVAELKQLINFLNLVDYVNRKEIYKIIEKAVNEIDEINSGE
jgi:hypothetical protein